MPTDWTQSLGNLSGLLPIVLIVVVFYFLLIRPQSKQRKKLKEMMDNLKVGDSVKTIGGLYGKIANLKEDVVTIECGPDKVKLVFARQAIGSVQNVDFENEIPDSEKLS
jgi:preprotein translocase subunit YajC